MFKIKNVKWRKNDNATFDIYNGEEIVGEAGIEFPEYLENDKVTLAFDYISLGKIVATDENGTDCREYEGSSIDYFDFYDLHDGIVAQATDLTWLKYLPDDKYGWTDVDVSENELPDEIVAEFDELLEYIAEYFSSEIDESEYERKDVWAKAREDDDRFEEWKERDLNSSLKSNVISV